MLERGTRALWVDYGGAQVSDTKLRTFKEELRVVHDAELRRQNSLQSKNRVAFHKVKVFEAIVGRGASSHAGTPRNPFARFGADSSPPPSATTVRLQNSNGEEQPTDAFTQACAAAFAHDKYSQMLLAERTKAIAAMVQEAREERRRRVLDVTSLTPAMLQSRIDHAKRLCEYETKQQV